MKQTTIKQLLIILIVINSVIPAVSKVPRRILIEEFTETGCAWCVRGLEQSEYLLDKYPDRLIVAALHDNDEISTKYPSQIYHGLDSVDQFGGYPSGILNRLKFGNGLYQSPYESNDFGWPLDVKFRLKDSTAVDVDVNYSVASVSKKLTALVTAKLTDDYDGQLAFNLYVMEDCVGPYTQGNAYSGYTGHEDYPYYYEPEKIPNFYYDNILRDMAGGAWGVKGSFPDSVKAGESFSHTFEVDLSKLQIKNYSNLWVIGLVEETAPKYEILNTRTSGKIKRPRKYKVYPDSLEYYETVKLNSSFDKAINYRNLRDVDLMAHFEISKDNSDIPDDWEVTLDTQTLLIKADSTNKINLKVHVGSLKSNAKISIKASVLNGESYIGDTILTTFYMITNGYENCIFFYPDDLFQKPLIEAIHNLPDIAVNTVRVPITKASINQYQNYPFKIIIFEETYQSWNRFLLNDTFMLNMITDDVIKGKNYLLTSNECLNYLRNLSLIGQNIVKSKKLFYSILGISGFYLKSYYMYDDWNHELIQTNIYGNEDSISNELTFTINQFDSTAYPYHAYYSDIINIVNHDKASPILFYDVDSLAALGMNTAAVKIQTSTNRDIYMGFGFELIRDINMRTVLLNNMLLWLNGNKEIEKPEVINTSDLTIMPNPVSNAALISFSCRKNSAADIYLVDINGSRVKDIFNGALDGEEQILDFSRAGLPTGKYFVISNINGVMSITPLLIVE